MDVDKRSCTITASVNGCLVIMQVKFPPDYPINSAPSFQFCQGTTVDDMITSELLKVLKQTAQQRVSKNRTCLEPCLRRFVASLEHLSANLENKDLNYKVQHPYFEPVFGSFNDAYIPFPRTSGAKFCSVSTLVCFGRPPNARRLSMKMESVTPRALSALANNLAGRNSVSTDNISISSFYFQDRVSFFFGSGDFFVVLVKSCLFCRNIGLGIIEGRLRVLLSQYIIALDFFS